MPPLSFEKLFISDERYESCSVFDVDNDGHLDIVSGKYWYPGPDFSRKCKIGDVQAESEYFDAFSELPLDVNGNGYLDFITGGWWGENLRWRENPCGARDREWTEHVIAQTGNIETTRMWDMDGDGIPEILPNTPGEPQRIYKLITDTDGKGTGAFDEIVIYAGDEDGRSRHGLGAGDITGNGRMDVVLAHGWLEAPPTLQGEWRFHPDFDLGSASVPILVADVDGDGLNDLIVGQAHGYGLDWWQQTRQGDRRIWIKHAIDPDNSQYHDLWWVDIDNDGQCELVTGKRYRAHCGHDPGAYDPYGIYYFKWNGEYFVKQVIEYGPIRQTTGCGIAFQVVDLDGNGWLDIVAPGKDGLYVFKNLGFANSNRGD